jgi:hypothetical protein
MNKLFAATVSAALAFSSVSPALAQDYRFAGGDAPRGLAATANLRIPLGPESQRRKASYGLTLGLGRTMGAGLDGRPVTRSVNLADLRFSGAGRISQARLTGVDLANLDERRRMNLLGGFGTTGFVLGAVAAGVGICLLTDCLGDDEDDPGIPNN